MIQGLHGGYNFVTVSTPAIFGTMPTLWTVPLEIHTALFDQALSMINAKCGNTLKQAGIYLVDMARTPFSLTIPLRIATPPSGLNSLIRKDRKTRFFFAVHLE